MAAFRDVRMVAGSDGVRMVDCEKRKKEILGLSGREKSEKETMEGESKKESRRKKKSKK